MKKYVLSVSVALMLCMCFLPATAWADGEDITDVSTTGLDLNGVTEETTYKAGEGTITFVPASDGTPATLTLNNATICAENGRFGVTAIQIPEGMPIEIIVPQGTESTIMSAKADGINHKGAPLTISGSGTLHIQADNDGITNDDDNGALAENKGSTLKIRDVTITLESTGSGSHGFYEGTSILIENAVIDARGAETVKCSDGIYADDTITIKSSEIHVSGSYYDGIAVSNDAITMEDSEITIEVRHGMNTYGNTNIRNTTLTITGKDPTESAAVFFKGPFTIDNSKVTITATEKAGIYSTSGRGTNGSSVLTVQNGSVFTAVGAENGVKLMKNGSVAIGTGLKITEGETHTTTEEDGTSTTATSARFVVMPITCTVTFDSRGGSAVESREVAYGNALAKPAAPTWAGYTFDGWYTDANCTAAYDFAAAVTGDMTLYAKWTPVPSDSGSAAGSSGSTVTTYPPTVERPGEGGGKPDVSPASPRRGERVTITPKPDKGFEADSVIVTDRNGDPVKVTDNGDGTYRFTQPGSKVTISVTYREIDTSCDGGVDCPSRALTDLDVTAWYHEAVDYALDNGLMRGYDDGTFRPNARLSRAMLAQILYNREGRPAVIGGRTFTDVPEDMWCADAVQWAAENGIVTGYADGAFRPNDDLKREQLAAMLYRYARLKGYDTTQGGMAIREFDDYSSISGYAMEAMDWAVNTGVVGGYGDNTLRPLNSATRAQTAQMLKNFLENGTR